MASSTAELSSVRKHLAVLEETFQAEHNGAPAGRVFEELLATAAMFFALFEELIRRRRERVFRGVDEASPERDAAERELVERWLAITDAGMPRLESLEATFGVVEGADRIRACREKARSLLANWAPAVLSRAVGLRVHDVTEEEADELRALLNAPPGAPGRLKWQPRSVPPGDPSLLR